MSLKSVNLLLILLLIPVVIAVDPTQSTFYGVRFTDHNHIAITNNESYVKALDIYSTKSTTGILMTKNLPYPVLIPKTDAEGYFEVYSDNKYMNYSIITVKSQHPIEILHWQDESWIPQNTTQIDTTEYYQVKTDSFGTFAIQDVKADFPIMIADTELPYVSIIGKEPDKCCQDLSNVPNDKYCVKNGTIIYWYSSDKDFMCCYRSDSSIGVCNDGKLVWNDKNYAFKPSDYKEQFYILLVVLVIIGSIIVILKKRTEESIWKNQ